MFPIQRPQRVLMSIAIFAGLLMPACGDGPRIAPTAPTPRPPGPASATPALVRIEIVGPDVIAPGESAQLTVRGIFSDGTTDVIESDLAWRSDTPGVLDVSPAGIAAAGQAGQATVRVSFTRSGAAPLQSGRRTLVLPPNTFWLDGHITELGAGDRGLGGVVVEIASEGPFKGRRQTTDAGGFFYFFGVAGPVTLRASLAGYERQERHLEVRAHQTLRFEMPLTQPRPDWSGRWTMTVTAAASCGATIPSTARSRTFEAAIVPDGRRADIAVTGATLRGRATTAASLGIDTITFSWHGGFDLNYFYGYGGYVDPQILDLLDSSTFYSAQGRVTVSGDGHRLSGTLDGRIGVLEASGAPRQVLASCQSMAHQVRFAR